MPSDPSRSNHSQPRITLALRVQDAAKAIGISPRLLAALVAEKRVPYLRVNSVLLFPVRELQEWLTAEAMKEGQQ